MADKTKVKKVTNIVLNVLLYVFLAICVVAVILTLISKKDSDGAMTVFGMQMRRVLTSSMDECDKTDVSNYDIKSIPVNSMVFIDVVPEDKEEAKEWYSNLKVGDVLTFRYVYTQQVTITHRIEEIEPNQRGGYTIRLTGDNKNDASGLLTQVIDTSLEDSPNYVIGKVTGQNYLLGLLMTLMTKPVGLVFLVIVPCFIIILLEVFRIINVVTADRRKKEKEEQEKKDSELEELRRKLAALENKQTEQTQEPKEESEE